MEFLSNKPLLITDTILRDAHQSQAATRMTLEQMLPACEILDSIGYYSLECWGGATFDACLRFLDEDPWERLRQLRAHLPHTKLLMLFRGQNILGYKHYADDVVDEFCGKSIDNGIDIIRMEARYFEDGGEVELSPRNLGILMHRAFEQADDEAGIHEAVRGMQADGTLSEADAATLRQMIARALEHPEVREWFGGGWERVRNENEIIIPGRGSTRRPDRVMIDGRRVVVVDYKFGLRDAERHRRQMREYLRLLGEMGYAPAEGYLWYVKLGKIEKVEP